jgi:hypothetical protein
MSQIRELFAGVSAQFADHHTCGGLWKRCCLHDDLAFTQVAAVLAHRGFALFLSDQPFFV